MPTTYRRLIPADDLVLYAMQRGLDIELPGPSGGLATIAGHRVAAYVPPAPGFDRVGA